MKSFIIQSLVLIGAVVVIVEAASISPNKTMLKYIMAYAKNMSETCSKEELKHLVKNPTGNLIKCVRCFFWRAEMSLSLTKFNESRLTRQLQVYNEETKPTNCHMTEKSDCTLEHLLTNISECAKDNL